MSLPDSSSKSGPSDGSGEPESKSGQAKTTERPPKKDHDLPLKLRVGSTLATSGYYTRINVGLSARSARGLADVTDVDVLAVRYDTSFAPSAIGVSCKSGASKALSPAREVFYLKGVLDYLGAGVGVVAF